LAVASSHDARNLGDCLRDGRVARLLFLASGGVTLLGVDDDVLCGFLVYLVGDSTHVGALAIVVIKLCGISLVVDSVVSSPTFGSVNSWSPVDVRP
jgi:hypothetical protein